MNHCCWILWVKWLTWLCDPRLCLDQNHRGRYHRGPESERGWTLSWDWIQPPGQFEHRRYSTEVIERLWPRLCLQGRQGTAGGDGRGNKESDISRGWKLSVELEYFHILLNKLRIFLNNPKIIVQGKLTLVSFIECKWSLICFLYDRFTRQLSN